MLLTKDDKKIEFRAIKYLEILYAKFLLIFDIKDNKNKIIFFESTLLFDKCIYRNKFYKQFLLGKINRKYNHEKFNNQNNFYLELGSFLFNICILFISFIFFSFESLTFLIIRWYLFKNSFSIKRKIRESSGIYFVYSSDEKNNFSNSRYFSSIKKTDIRISLGKPVNLISKLSNLDLVLNKNKSYNILPFEILMNQKDISRAYFTTFLIWFKSILHILNYLIFKIKNKKFFKEIKKLNNRVLIMQYLFRGSPIRRQLIFKSINKILEFDNNFHIPIEGAYWEKAFLNFSEEKSNTFNGYINAVPKIYDSRMKTFLKPSIVNSLNNINYKFPFIKGMLFYEKNFTKNINYKLGKKNRIINNQDLLFFFTGLHVHDKDLLNDIILIKSINPTLNIKVKFHPENDLKDFFEYRNLFEEIKLVNQVKEEDILICSIYSSYSFEINKLRNKKFIKYRKYKKFPIYELFPYLDPCLVVDCIMFSDIRDLI